MCGFCDGGALNWPSLPQLWFCFPFFCFLKNYAFQRVCWKLNYMHREASVFPCGLSTQHTLVTIYWAITILQVYILLLFSCPVVSDSSRPHGPHHLPEFAQVRVHFVWWCHSAISPSVALFCFHSFPASGSFPMSQLFASGDQSIGVQLQHQSFQWVFRGDSSKIDWFDLLAVHRTLKRLLQHHSSKASILWCSAFFMVQLWQPYMTTGKTITLTRQTFVGKVMPLLFNTPSRFAIAFLPRSSHSLISWL